MNGETAERILDVAHRLMVERGYSAFSYADIADEIQIRKASIHHHFPTKTALVVAVLERHRLRMEEGHASLDGLPSALERLKKYAGYWEVCVRDMTQPFCIAALLGAELPSLPEEVQAEVQKHFAALKQWLAKTLKDGVKQKKVALKGTVDVEAEMLMAAVHGGMISARVSHSSVVFKQIAASAIQRITS